LNISRKMFTNKSNKAKIDKTKNKTRKRDKKGKQNKLKDLNGKVEFGDKEQ
jgi:hypothetical protein